MLIKKAVTQVLAVLIIIATVFSAAALLYTYISGTVGESKEELSTSGSSLIKIENAYYEGVGVIHLRNIGEVSDLLDSIYLSLDGENWVKTVFATPNPMVPPGGTTVAFVSTENLQPGNYRLKVVMRSGQEAYGNLVIDGETIDYFFGYISTAYSKSSPLTLVNGFYGKYYDISDNSKYGTIPGYNMFLRGECEEDVFYEGIDRILDFTDHSSYGGSPWPFANIRVPDRFVALWSALIRLDTSSTLLFNIVTDDGIVILVDNKTVFSSWKLQAPTEYSFKVELEGGLHELKIVYFENYGIARLKVEIEVLREKSEETIIGKYYETNGESSRPSIEKILRGEYPLILEKQEETIDYTDNPDYGGSPWPISDTDTFTVHWRIRYFALTSGKYAVKTYNDDGVVVYIDNQTVINDWNLHRPKWNEAEVFLEKGYHVIDILYYENYGIARMFFSINPSTTQHERHMLNLTYTAKVYKLPNNWNDWTPEGYEKLYRMIVNGELDQIGTYSVSEIYFSDNPNYPGNPWFFSGVTDRFAAVFESKFKLEKTSIMYFDVMSDDGVRILLDDKIVLSDWSLHPPRASKSSAIVSPGEHSLKIVYFENYGIALLHVKLYYEEREQIEIMPYFNTLSTIMISFSKGSVKPPISITVIDDRGTIVGEQVLNKINDKVYVDLNRKLTFYGAIAIWRKK